MINVSNRSEIRLECTLKQYILEHVSQWFSAEKQLVEANVEHVERVELEQPHELDKLEVEHLDKQRRECHQLHHGIEPEMRRHGNQLGLVALQMANLELATDAQEPHMAKNQH